MIKHLKTTLFVLSMLFFGAVPSATAQETSADLSGGSIIVGYDNRTCDASLEGNIRYLGLGTTNGLVGHWPLNETSGTTATERSFNANNGTMQNGLTGTNSVTGVIDTALSFDGSDDSIDIASNPDYSLESFTYAIWIYIPTSMPSGWRAAMAHDRSGTNWVFLGKTSGASTIHWRWSSGDTMNSTATISVDTWHHIAGTYDYATNTARLYIDGVLDNTDSAGGTQPTANDALLRIGRNTNDTETWTGYLDDARIYNRALSATEIAEIHSSSCDTTPTTYTTPGGPYTFNGSSVPGCGSIKIEAYGAGGGAGTGGGGGGSAVLNGAVLQAAGGGGGGGGEHISGDDYGGGGGGYGASTISVTGSTSLNVYVGGGGLCNIGAGGPLSGGAADSKSGTGPATAGNSTYGGGGAARLNSVSTSTATAGDSTYGGGGAAHCNSTTSSTFNGGDSTYGGGGGVTEWSCSSSTINYGTSTNGNAGTTTGGGGGGYDLGSAGDISITGSNGAGTSGGAAAKGGPGDGGDTGCSAGGDGQVVITGVGSGAETKAIQYCGMQACDTTPMTISTPGTNNYTVPAGCNSVTVQVWGAGAGGDDGGLFSSGDGGGGGAYAEGVVSVTAGNSYDAVVGVGGFNNTAGADSYFINTSTVMAKGGSNARTGGQASASVGTTKYDGGNGGTGAGFGAAGAGGGGSAGSGGAGSNGTNGGSGTRAGGAGGTPDGGAGGDGSNGADGGAGTQPGGGGAGGGDGNSNGGTGANGQIIITPSGPGGYAWQDF